VSPSASLYLGHGHKYCRATELLQTPNYEPWMIYQIIFHVFTMHYIIMYYNHRRMTQSSNLKRYYFVKHIRDKYQAA